MIFLRQAFFIHLIEGDFPFTRGVEIGEIVASAFFFLIVDAILYPIFGAIAGMIAASLIKGPAQEPTPA